ATFRSILLGHERPALISAKLIDASDPDSFASLASFREPTGCGFPCLFASAQRGLFVGAGMMVVARDAFDRSGGFLVDRLNAEDHDLALKLGAERGFVQVTEPVTLIRRIHVDNETQNH